MRIKLDLEDVRFYTTRSEDFGDIRWMVVTIKGKHIYVQRRIFDHLSERFPERQRGLDELLVEKMEHILQGAFYAGIATIPDGPIE